MRGQRRQRNSLVTCRSSISCLDRAMMLNIAPWRMFRHFLPRSRCAVERSVDKGGSVTFSFATLWKPERSTYRRNIDSSRLSRMLRMMQVTMGK
jgi:hypothetical protein